MTYKREGKHNKDASGQPQEKAGSCSPELREGKPGWIYKAIETADRYSNLIVAIATVFVSVLTVVLAWVAVQQTDVARRALELSSRRLTCPLLLGHPWSSLTPIT